MRRSSEQFEVKTAIVCADTHRPVEGQRLRSKQSLPNQFVVGVDHHLVVVDDRAQSILLALLHLRENNRSRWLDVVIAMSTTFFRPGHARIAFHGYYELWLGLDAPHGVDQIATILGAKLQTELAAQLARRQRSTLPGWT